MAEPQVSPPPPEPHRWSYDLRRWVIIGLVVAGAFFLYFIRETLPTLVLALLLAYLLNPLVGFFKRRLGLPRLAALGLVYLIFIIALIELPVLFGPNLVREVASLASQLDSIIEHLLVTAQNLPLLSSLLLQIDTTSLTAQLRDELGQLAQQSPRYALGAASSLFNLLAVLVLSFYLLKDVEQFAQSISEAIPPAYRDDAARIGRELDAVWAGFLRGQLLLALIIGVVTTLTLTVLGVRNALILGFLAGVLEVVPTIGPIIASIPAVLIALLQGSTNWPLDNMIFALVVIAAYVIIQQLEAQLIVPNVLGASVDLPPVAILAGALVGGSLAGILGIFLAAPVLATARLVFRYLIRKLFEPLPEHDPDPV